MHLCVCVCVSATARERRGEERRKNSRKIILTLTNCNTSSFLGMMESSSTLSLQRGEERWREERRGEERGGEERGEEERRGEERRGGERERFHVSSAPPQPPPFTLALQWSLQKASSLFLFPSLHSSHTTHSRIIVGRVISKEVSSFNMEVCGSLLWWFCVGVWVSVCVCVCVRRGRFGGTINVGEINDTTL